MMQHKNFIWFNTHLIKWASPSSVYDIVTRGEGQKHIREYETQWNIHVVVDL